MQISQAGTNLIKQEEGFRSDAYQDGGGVWTIGYGSTRINGRPVTKGDKVDEPTALQMLITKANSDLSEVSAVLKTNLNQNQTDAIASFVYNIGLGQFKSSTLLSKLNASDFAGAADQFARWIYDNGKVVNGLIRRRAQERALFLKA